MKPIAIFLLSGDVDDQERSLAADALANRGFEVFAERPLENRNFRELPGSFVAGGHALIAINPLMSAGALRGKAVFADTAVEKAVLLLCRTLSDAANRLRVTTDTTQAIAFASELLTAEELDRMDDLVVERQKEMATDLPVLADLSRLKYRAKVELVEWNGQKAVKKTFRPAARDAMDRELAFYEDVSRQSDVPARILARNENAILFEYIENRFKIRRLLGFRVPVPLPLARLRELAAFIDLVTRLGWDPIDLTPRDNILIDARTGRLRAIDFEFAHHRDAPVDPVDAYFLSGVPPDANVACPLNNAMELDPYPGKWRPFTGLSKTSFLRDPAWLQRIKRLLIHPFWLSAHVIGAIQRRRRYNSERDALLRAVALHRSLSPQDYSSQ